MDEMLGVVLGLDGTKDRLTVVVDKGMNSEDNFAWIDEHQRVHFVTAYSPYFAQDLAETPIEKFQSVNTRKNLALAKAGREHDQIKAFRTTSEFWGKERSVVVTYYPPTARKQSYTFESKLSQVREELLLMRDRVNNDIPRWRDADEVHGRYLRLCEQLRIASVYYELEFAKDSGQMTMAFRKNHYEVDKKSKVFGRSIIVTDNTDWTTSEIVQAHLDRWQVENGFRQSKDSRLVATRPVRHWTDSKIRCHLFTCVVALTYLRRLELRLQAKGFRRTAGSAMEDLRKLHSVLSVRRDERKPRRALEQPSRTQAEVLLALGYQVDPSGGLHPLGA
jgi:transposase